MPFQIDTFTRSPLCIFCYLAGGRVRAFSRLARFRAGREIHSPPPVSPRTFGSGRGLPLGRFFSKWPLARRERTDERKVFTHNRLAGWDFPADSNSELDTPRGRWPAKPRSAMDCDRPDCPGGG